ncbi:MAG: HAD family hydrolase [Terriglobales bacterium]
MIKFNQKFDPSQIRLLIFDLDGTLIDSRLDLIHSVNAMLRHFGLAELPGDVVASYVGDGASMLVRRALGDPSDEDFFKSGLEYFLAYYREHKLDFTVEYPGITNALTRIRQPSGHGRQMAVLSNKPVLPARAIVKALGLSDFFVSVYGGDSFSTKKPDPLGVNTLLNQTGRSPKDSIIVGDSSVDIVTGRNAGIWTCGVTYGFAPQSLSIAPPDVLIDRADDLGELFG